MLEVELAGTRKVSRLELTLDSNDRYAVELVGKNETREIVFGTRADELKKAGKPPGEQATTETTRVIEPPDDTSETTTSDEATESAGSKPKLAPPLKKPKKEDDKKPFKGLALYTRTVEPPVEGVHIVRVRPISGDRGYALGHLLVK